MAGKLTKYQMLNAQHWMGLTKENHLAAIFQKAPQQASVYMVNLLGFQVGKTLETMLSKFPTKEFDSDDEYTWHVVGSDRRNIPLVEARDLNGNTITTGMAGANLERFYLVFPETWFADGEYIVGELNEIYQFRILGDPKQEGTNAVYCVELAGGNTEGVPAERLQPGERFSYEAAFIEKELSRKVGDVRYASPMAMRNEFSRVRIQHKVPGTMLNEKLVCGIPVAKENANGRTTYDVMTGWMHVVEWKVEQTFSEYKNNALAFGRSNRTENGEYLNVGKSGNVIKTGMGLYQQMESGNTMYYNDFSLKIIEDALYDISRTKLGYGERTFIIRTGELGAKQLHKAIKQEVSGWTMFDFNGDALGVVKKTTASFTGNTQALAAGFQFTEWMAPNGVHVKIEVDPYYDDPVRNKIEYPDGSGPAFSYRYDIFDIGTMDQPNIFKCTVKGQAEFRGLKAA